jgi:monovalent cation/hydrogen antiporter
MHEYLILGIGLILVVSLLVMLGQYLRISYPIFLVIGGLLISFIPGLPPIKIDPELIFLIFLPPLLYEAAWNTSWKDFWRWRRIISVFAFGLVIVTSCTVALVSNAMIPDFTLSLGFLLGGIISPPDAVAATSVLRGIKIPKRVLVILEGESLVNDASSLIVFRFALAAVLTGSFIFQQAAVNFVLVTVMGIGVGIVVAIIFYSMHRWLPTTASIDTALSLVAPYAMYITAEQFHFSGVMAVVSGGLFISYRSHRIFNHSTRIQSSSMRNSLGFILNGLVFMLIGLELPTVISGMGEYSLTDAVIYALIISAVVIVTRIGFVLFSSVFTVYASKVITTADSRPGWRGPLIVGWAGMRGVVSLASALSIPLLLANGQVFPQRNLILFITFVVILVTLILQGLTLPLVIRWVKYEDPDHSRPAAIQEFEIRSRLSAVAAKEFRDKYADQVEGNDLLKALQLKIERDLKDDKAEPRQDLTESSQSLQDFIKIYIELISLQRKELHQLRKVKEYDHDVIRNLEAQMDLEEEKLRLQQGTTLLE